jgi:hypothetical protein
MKSNEIIFSVIIHFTNYLLLFLPCLLILIFEICNQINQDISLETAITKTLLSSSKIQYSTLPSDRQQSLHKELQETNFRNSDTLYCIIQLFSLIPSHIEVL